MHLKWKLRTCRIQIELEKVGFVCEKKKIFQIHFLLLPYAQGNQKILDVQFFQIFEKQTPSLAFLDLASIQRNKVRNFGYGSPDLVRVADGFMVGGALIISSYIK